MIGEVPALAPRKKVLNICNVVMSIFGAIFMIVACASFGTSANAVRNLAFAFVSVSYDYHLLGGAPVTNCVGIYVGLQAYCQATCGEATLYAPADYWGRKCYDEPTLVTGSSGKQFTASIDVFSYDSLYQSRGCSNLNYYVYYIQTGKPISAYDELVENCNKYDTCRSAGKVTMAFAVLGCLGAFFAVAVFAWRIYRDGAAAKLTSVIVSIVTFICCVVAFGSFQKCVKLYSDQLQASAKSLAATFGDDHVAHSSVPGVGGDMAITSFVFFMYVMVMSVLIPGGAAPGAEAAAAAGLDNKAPAYPTPAPAYPGASPPPPAFPTKSEVGPPPPAFPTQPV